MRPVGYAPYDDDLAQRPAGERHREDVGPQGAALILELRRLRHAFEHDLNSHDSHGAPSRRPAREQARPSPPKRGRQPKHRKKSGMGRVLEACLDQFRSGPPEPARRREYPRGPNVAPPLPRRRSPVMPGESIPMDLSRLGPAMPGLNRAHQPTATDVPLVASPRLAADIRLLHSSTVTNAAITKS